MGNSTSVLVPIYDPGDYELSEADDEYDDDDDVEPVEVGIYFGMHPDFSLVPQDVPDAGTSTLASVVASDSWYTPAFDADWDSVDEYAGAWGLEPDSEDNYDSSYLGSDSDSETNDHDHDEVVVVEEQEEQVEEEEVVNIDINISTSTAEATPAPIYAALASYIPGPSLSFPPPNPFLQVDPPTHSIDESPSFAFEWAPEPSGYVVPAPTSAPRGFYTGANSGLTLIPGDVWGYIDPDNEFNTFGTSAGAYDAVWRLLLTEPAPTTTTDSPQDSTILAPVDTPSVTVTPTPVSAPVPATAPVSVQVAPIPAPPPTPATDVQVLTQAQKAHLYQKWIRHRQDILRRIALTRYAWRLQVSRERWWTRVVTREAR